MRCTRGESGKETSWSQTLRTWKRWTHLKSTQKDSMQRAHEQSVRNRAITRGNASSPVAGQALRRPRILLWVETAVKSHRWPKTGRVSSARRITSCLLSFQGCPPILKAVGLQHRYHRTRREERSSAQWTGATCFKFIFKFSIWAKWRTGIQETGAIPRIPKAE